MYPKSHWYCCPSTRQGTWSVVTLNPSQENKSAWPILFVRAHLAWRITLITNYINLLRYGGNNLFVPANKEEEVLPIICPFIYRFRSFCCCFLLRLWQANMSPSIRRQSTIHTGDFLLVSHLRWLIESCIRENTMMSATAVFNLMSLACARSGHYKVVTDMFERSLRFCPKVGSQMTKSTVCTLYLRK